MFKHGGSFFFPAYIFVRLWRTPASVPRPSGRHMDVLFYRAPSHGSAILYFLAVDNFVWMLAYY